MTTNNDQGQTRRSVLFSAIEEAKKTTKVLTDEEDAIKQTTNLEHLSAALDAALGNESNDSISISPQPRQDVQK
jgi:hypothetical protein